MLGLATHVMVYLGSILMAYNIFCFARFVRFIKKQVNWGDGGRILNIPIALLILFLIGYLVVGIFSDPTPVVAGILFGGSIFVYAMYNLLRRITSRIIESERLEAELMASEKSNQAKTDFLASMSHEMRTPMNVILGLSGIMLGDSSLSEESHDRVRKIDLSARHLLGLINNILDMNRIESGDLVLKSEDFSLRDALAQVDALVQTQCEEKGLSYEASIDNDAPDWCTGDAMQVKQVLLSILDNAVKYTDVPGSVSMSVHVLEHAANQSTVEFCIADTGIGMDEEFLQNIFEAFGQEDISTTNRFGGSGLSLAISNSIVDAMGGTISVTSKKHEGSTFAVAIPLTLAQQPAKPKEQDAGPIQSLAGRRILIVEDIEENAEIVADLLELEDALSEHAQNGQIAVTMFDESAPYYYDAVLMDLRMPVMDGLEATQAIRALNRPDAQSVPIIALTANAFESDVQQTADAGMNAHLAKPADVDLLYATLLKHINASAQQNEESR